MSAGVVERPYELYSYVRKYEWGNAENKLKELNKLVAKEYLLDTQKNEEDKRRARKKVKDNDRK